MFHDAARGCQKFAWQSLPLADASSYTCLDGCPKPAVLGGAREGIWAHDSRRAVWRRLVVSAQAIKQSEGSQLLDHKHTHACMHASHRHTHGMSMRAERSACRAAMRACTPTAPAPSSGTCIGQGLSTHHVFLPPPAQPCMPHFIPLSMRLPRLHGDDDAPRKHAR